MKKKGFVLMETIAVIVVMCIILVMLYVSFNYILTSVQTKTLYDNSEYIYNTNLIRTELLKLDNIYDEINKVSSSSIVEYYKRDDSLYNDKCDAVFDISDIQMLFCNLNVKYIYFIPWNVDEIDSDQLKLLPATLKDYIEYLDFDSDSESKRIIVAYINDYETYNDLDNSGNVVEKYIETLEYASLKIGEKNEE